jgi:hypothetical protein
LENRRFNMKRLSLVILLGAAMIGCTTSPQTARSSHRAQTAKAGDTTASRQFSLPFEQLLEASKAACEDLGATVGSVVLDEKGGKLDASRFSGSWNYIVVAFFVEDGGAVKITIVPGLGLGEWAVVASGNRSDYDEFWAALDAHL